MATANRVNKFAEDTTDDLPDEYNSVAGAQSNSSTNGNMIAGVSWDDFGDLRANADVMAAERKRLNPPSGDWLKRDRWEIKRTINEGDSLPGDVLPGKGRLVFSIYGKPEARQVDSDEYQPVLFIRVSPDRRFKQDDPTKIDGATKLWIYAEDLYLAINKEETHEVKKIVNMLIEEEYKISTYLPPNSDSGLMVTRVKTKELQRRERK